MAKASATDSGLLLGLVIAVWLNGLAFTRPLDQLSRDSLVPLGSCLLGTLVCVLVNPGAVRKIMIRVVAPSLLISSLLFFGTVQDEQGPAWGHVQLLLKVLAAAGVGSAVGYLIGRRYRTPGPV